MRSAAARLIGSIALVAALAGCSASGPAARTAGVPALDPDGWTDSVYQKLTDTIAGAAGQGRTVVFDFDNTTQAHDISEAVHPSQGGRTNAVDPTALSPAMYPPAGCKRAPEWPSPRGVGLLRRPARVRR